jgi:single-stranded DNA-specific DHH superfamily exonuclease
MTADIRKQFDKVFLQLQELGLLLLSDANLPSVSGIVTGEKLRGSWWAHKQGQTIFAISEMLEDHTDVLITKLISDKVTFVHRELWGRIYSIGVAREDWQLKNLSAAAKLLLQAVDAEGTLGTNKLGKKLGTKPARELELRLLVHAEQKHSESGAHTKMLETWDTWAERAGFRAKAQSAPAARRFLEQRLAQINMNNGYGTLPWTNALK